MSRISPRPRASRVAARLACTIPAAVALACAASDARASFLAGEALDKAADVLAWVVLILVPLIGIVVFWMVHVLPEKIAHKRHHPQTQAIQTLCLLSLVFGGLLWPIAWLWAYTKPVAYKLAYGTDRSEDYFLELGEKARAGTLNASELRALETELEAMHARGGMSPALATVRDEVAQLQQQGERSAATARAATAQSELRSA